MDGLQRLYIKGKAKNAQTHKRTKFVFSMSHGKPYLQDYQPRLMNIIPSWRQKKMQKSWAIQNNSVALSSVSLRKINNQEITLL